MAIAAKQTVPDPSFYPVEDDMGESTLQRLITELLRPLLARFLAERGERAFVGADQFIYWQPHAPTKCVAPDVYVLPSVDPARAPGCWKTWETDVVPSFALEIVSDDLRKDYEEAPRRYEELGVGELVIFDPEGLSSPERVRWQIYRRLGARGFVLVRRTNADRVRSRALRCWLRVVGEGEAQRIRIATGPRGEELAPTDAERADAAEAELAVLRAEVERLRGR
jgi:Uma2 family endonuclease